MATYAVAISRTETATYQVEADDAPTAEKIALEKSEGYWEPDTVDTQVDDVSELVVPA